MCPRAHTEHSCVCVVAQTRGLSCQVTQSKKMVSECLLWVGPCPGHCVCLCELHCVLVCVCVSTEGGGAEPSFPSPGRLQKAELVIHQLHPPSLGPAWPELREGSFLEKCVCVGGSKKTMRAWAGFAGFPCCAPWEYIWVLHPSSSHPLDPSSCPRAKAGGRGGEGVLAGRGTQCRKMVGGENWARGGGEGGRGGSEEMQTKCWPRVQSRKTDSRGSLQRGSL